MAGFHVDFFSLHLVLISTSLLLFKIDFTQGFRFHFWCEDEAVLVEVNLVQGFTQNPDLNVCFESDGGKNLQIEIFVLQHFFSTKKIRKKHVQISLQ